MSAAYQNGGHTRMNEVLYREIKTLQIHFKEGGADWKWRRCCVDGLIIGVEADGWLRVEMAEPGQEVVRVLVKSDSD